MTRLGPFLTLDRWDSRDWQLGCGWWDGAFEIYLGKWIVRC